MSQSNWPCLIYNTKENYEKFNSMLKVIYHPSGYREYRGYELSRWVGLRINYVENRVKPREFYDENPNFEK